MGSFHGFSRSILYEKAAGHAIRIATPDSVTRPATLLTRALYAFSITCLPVVTFSGVRLAGATRRYEPERHPRSYLFDERRSALRRYSDTTVALIYELEDA